MIFSVHNKSNGYNICVTDDGLTIVTNLTLEDEVTGNKWTLKVNNGQLIIEPLDSIDKRDIKINKILNG